MNLEKPAANADTWPMVILILGFFAMVVGITYIFVNKGC